MLSPSIKDEIKNALWGCVEIPLFLKKGATRFTGTVSAFKHSFLVPILFSPIIAATIPVSKLYTDKSFLWVVCLYFLQFVIATSIFMGAVWFFKSKQVTKAQYLQCISAYNWLGLSCYVVNLPLILMGHLGVHPWGDIFAMMLLTNFYCYSYLAYMITHVLKTNAFVGTSLAILDMLLGDVIRNLTIYLMTHL